MRPLIGFLLIHLTLASCPPALASAPAAGLPPHPRLLATSADFDRIREAVKHPGPMRDTFELVRATAEREFAEPPLERRMVGIRLLATSRNAVRRIWNGALLHRVTGERRWLERTEREMLALAAFTDWNPRHFLDTAEAAAALAVGYDWLHADLPSATRATLRDALVKHALRPGSNNYWQKYRNNWTQVCEAGLVLAALAVAEDEPALARATLARALETVPASLPNYAPDGACLEGPTYWEYGTTYHVLLIEALRVATGSADAVTSPAFLASGEVVNILTGPAGGFFNYGDADRQRLFMPALYWFAREHRRPDIAAAEHAVLHDLLQTPHLRSDNVPFPNRFLALALLWMDAAPSPVPPRVPASWATRGENPLVIFRRGEGPASLFAGMKGGRARISHAHMDAGSFVLDAGGVRWTADLGMQSYHALEKAGLKLFGADRWRIHAFGPYSHSVPLIDDRMPDDEATATLRDYSTENQSAVIDLTPLYAAQAKRLSRGLRVEGEDTVVLRDEITGAAPGARYRWTWMTYADAVADATGVTLRSGGRALRLDVSADAPVEIDVEDASAPPAPFDAAQPGLRRISVLFTVARPLHALEVRATLLP